MTLSPCPACSMVIDALLTGLVGFNTQAWHVYAAAGILPLASGTAPACKGVILGAFPLSLPPPPLPLYRLTVSCKTKLTDVCPTTRAQSSCHLTSAPTPSPPSHSLRSVHPRPPLHSLLPSLSFADNPLGVSSRLSP